MVTYVGLRATQPEHGHGGPRRLAQAILNDFTGRTVELATANAFLRDVVAHLPSEFELTGEDVAAWLAALGPDD
ncbi:MAG TPA: DUF6166 domain-containing protein [Solirubrobacteraceae bacterium]|nr:DUF6166 domain-containing protein [Solirubrobacteraceae bacterium]